VPFSPVLHRHRGAEQALSRIISDSFSRDTRFRVSSALLINHAGTVAVFVLGGRMVPGDNLDTLLALT
jgi:hypothetical protein